MRKSSIGRLLIVGGGSVGKRHLENFARLGVPHIGVVDVRQDRLDAIRQMSGGPSVYRSLDEGLSARYDAAVICTPTAFHTEGAAAAVRVGAHVLMEKPISHSLDGVLDTVADARAAGLVFMVGYTYRFWPPLVKAREILQSGALGRPLSASITFSQYLPDWHPWEDYRTWFMASASQGGGALLDESHALDLVRWIFGEVTEVACATGRVSSLEITSDDFAHLLLKTEGGARAVLQLDLLGRRPKRRMEVTCEGGELTWDFAANRLEVLDVSRREESVFTFSCDRNDMFVAEAAHFLACVEGTCEPCVSGEDAIETLRVVLAARSGSATARPALHRAPSHPSELDAG